MEFRDRCQETSHGQLDTRCHHVTVPHFRVSVPVHISYNSQRGTSRGEHGTNIVDRLITVFICKHVATSPPSIHLFRTGMLLAFADSLVTPENISGYICSIDSPSGTLAGFTKADADTEYSSLILSYFYGSFLVIVK